MLLSRFKEIDICKGIGILTVIWHHSLIKYPVNLLCLPWCQNAWRIDHLFFMQIFFLVAGYLFGFSKRRVYCDVVKSKIKRLLIPYLSFCLVSLALKIAVPQLVNRRVVDVGTYLYDMAFHGGELWFVYVLFLMFMAWPLLLWRSNRTAQLVVIGGLVILNEVLSHDFLNGFLLNGEFVRYSIFFVSGYMLKDVDRSKLADKRGLMVSALLFMGCCIMQIRHWEAFPLMWLLMSVVGCWFVWSLSFQIERISGVSNVLQYLGRNSLPLYWLNGFALVAVRSVAVKLIPDGHSVMLALSIFAGCVLTELLALQAVKHIPVVRHLIGVK